MQRSHYLAISGLVALFALGAVLLTRTRLPRRISSLPSQVAQTAAQLMAKPETLPTDAIAQRYRAKHEAINAMRRDLAHLVTLESTYVADSGHLYSALSPFGFSVARGSWLNFQLETDGWNAIIRSTYTHIRCSVYVHIPADSRVSIADSIVCAAPPRTIP
jgi:hypothetical protein